MDITVTRRALSVGGFEIYWYGVLIALGAAAAYFFAQRQERLRGYKKDTVIDYLLVFLPAGLVGARLYYVALYPGRYETVADILRIRDGGLAIYGGLIAGFLAGFVQCLIRRDDPVSVCDLIFPNVALAQAIGRWGNFLNGEAYGVEIGAKWLRFFPAAVRIDGGWYAAAFFYESVWCFGIFLLSILPGLNERLSKRGSRSLLYFLAYALERCAVEGIRTDSLYLGSVRASQLLSAMVLLFGSVLLIRRLRRFAFAAPFAAGAVLGALGLIPVWTLYACLALWAFTAVWAVLFRRT